MPKNASFAGANMGHSTPTLLLTCQSSLPGFSGSAEKVQPPSTSAPATPLKSPPKPSIPFMRSPTGSGCVYTGRIAPTQPK